MKRLASWSAILAVTVLALGAAAQAAVVDVNLAFDKTSGIAVGEVVNWSMIVQVSDNVYNGFDAGLQALAVGINSTAEVGQFQEGVGPFGPTGALDTGIYNTATPDDGSGFGAPPLGFTAAYGPNGGITDQLLSEPLKTGAFSGDDYTAGFGDLAPKNKLGVTPIVYASGTWTATAEGTTTFTPFVGSAKAGEYNISIYTVNGTGGMSQRNLTTNDTLTMPSIDVTVGAAANTPPTAAIDTAAVAEGDWTGPGGWNNPARTVAIAATASDADGDPLTYEWKITAPASQGGATTDLGQNVEDLTLTIQMLMDAGVVLPADGSLINTNPENYTYSLQMFAFDGTDTTPSNSINVFVPEPATIGLLGFGVVGLLKRRRRA